ncbi:MAG: hypothetical protein AAGJ52_06850 [Pseudomonadota bacterium]
MSLSIRRKHWITGFLLVSIAVTVTAWLNRNTFPETMPWVPDLAFEPRQSSVNDASFITEANDVRYEVQPLYDYELTGLVVSFKRFTPGIGLHERWNDYINVADVCVVWGENASDIDLNQFDFWNLEFTCYIQTRDMAAWQAFDQDALANNHLLTDNAYVQSVIDDLRVGDIVRLEGQLVEYGEPGRQKRGTSTTRTDRGNGACETIFVEHAAILGSMNNSWRSIFWLGVFGIITALIAWFTSPVAALR